MKSLVPLLLALCIPLPAVAEDTPLRDQHGRIGGLDPACRHQLAIVVSASRLRRIGKWERKLRERFPDLHVVRVADVPQTAPVDYDTVAGKLRKRLPEDVDVLVDLHGAWASRHELDTSVPNLLLFGGDVVISRHAGMYKRALFDAVAADLERHGATCDDEQSAGR